MCFSSQRRTLYNRPPLFKRYLPCRFRHFATDWRRKADTWEKTHGNVSMIQMFWFLARWIRHKISEVSELRCPQSHFRYLLVHLFPLGLQVNGHGSVYECVFWTIGFSDQSEIYGWRYYEWGMYFYSRSIEMEKWNTGPAKVPGFSGLDFCAMSLSYLEQCDLVSVQDESSL
jgi:hypothetical protein